MGLIVTKPLHVLCQALKAAAFFFGELPPESGLKKSQFLNSEILKKAGLHAKVIS
ncbi:MAG: hypothetical protein M0Z61_06275 [Nitrospiraceae bacterium]|nr:hypothetical protein [Nitrospiraceae bacterium]